MTTFSAAHPAVPTSLASDPVARALEENLLGRASGDGAGPALVSCDMDRACHLADRVLALREPWCSRFVDYIVFRVSASMPEGQHPPRAQVAAWLTNERLHRLVWVLLRRLLSRWGRGND